MQRIRCSSSSRRNKKYLAATQSRSRKQQAAALVYAICYMSRRDSGGKRQVQVRARWTAAGGKQEAAGGKRQAAGGRRACGADREGAGSGQQELSAPRRRRPPGAAVPLPRLACRQALLPPTGWISALPLEFLRNAV